MGLNKKSKAIIIGIPLSIIFLFLAVRKVDINQLFHLIKNTNFLFLIPAVLAIMGDFSSRSMRWYFFLKPIKKCRLINLTGITFIGFFANMVLPMRAGEIIRIIMLGKKEDIPRSSTVATIILERILDVFAILLLVLITFSVFPYPPNIKRMWIIGLIFLFVTLFLSYLIIANPEATVKYISKLTHILPGRFKEKSSGILISFLEGFKSLKKAHLLLATAGISLAVWISDAGVFYFVAKGMGIEEISPLGSLFIMAFIALGISIPSSPGFVGVYEYFGILACTILGVSKTEALGFILLSHGIQFITMMTIGTFFLTREHISLIQLEKTAEKESA